MKVLISNPGCVIPVNRKYEKYYIRAGTRWPHSGIKKKGDLPHYLPFPFFLAYAAAWLRQNGFQTDVLDCIALDLSEKAFLGHIMETRPGLVFFEATTPTINYDLRLLKKIKSINPEILTAIGGPHATALSSELMRGNTQIDFILLGEYEEVFLRLLQAVRSCGNYSDVKGVLFRQGTDIVNTGYAPLIEPLDRLPLPAREMFPSPAFPDPALYWDGFCQKRPAIQMHTSRGCPNKCGFCLWNQVMYRNGKRRAFSPERVADEMVEISRKYKAKEIYFDDDDLTAGREHAFNLCGEIKRRKLKTSWSCMANIASLDGQLIIRMAESGCIGIKFGVESACRRVLKSMGKPVSLRKAELVKEWCRSHRIKTHAAFSLGLYGDDILSIRSTARYIRGFDSDTLQISIATPYPGTDFFNKAAAEGLLASDKWEKYDRSMAKVINVPGFGGSELMRLRNRVMISWIVRRLFSLDWIKSQRFIVFRALQSWSFSFVLSQLRAVIPCIFLRRQND